MPPKLAARPAAKDRINLGSEKPRESCQKLIPYITVQRYANHITVGARGEPNLRGEGDGVGGEESRVGMGSVVGGPRQWQDGETNAVNLPIAR